MADQAGRHDRIRLIHRDRRPGRAVAVVALVIVAGAGCASGRATTNRSPRPGVGSRSGHHGDGRNRRGDDDQRPRRHRRRCRPGRYVRFRRGYACADSTTWDSTPATFTLTDAARTPDGLLFETLTVHATGPTPQGVSQDETISEAPQN